MTPASRAPASRAPASTAAPADRGSATLYFVIFTIAAFMLVNLVVDGGAAISAKERAADIAGQAARAAANDLSIASLRSGGAPVLAPDACARAASLIGSYRLEPRMSVAMNNCSGAGTEQASVTVTVTTTPLIPGLIGSIPQQTTATAIPECGVTQGVQC